MAQSTATKAKGTRQAKPRLHPLLAQYSEYASQGRVPKTDAKGANITRFDDVPPYFNKVTGGAGKDKLQLSRQAFSKARQAGREIIFLRNPRVVGTREEISAEAARAGVNPADLLQSGNVIDEASLSGIHAGFFGEESSRISSGKGRAAKDNAELDAKLEAVSRLADVRKSQKGQPKPAKTPKGAKSAKGAKVKNLLDRYNALPAGKALNVSKMTSTGTEVHQVNVPGEGSAAKNVSSGRFPRLYSNNENTYRQALVSLGLSPAEADAEAVQLRARLGGAAAASSVVAAVPPATVGAMSSIPVLGSAVRQATPPRGLAPVPSIVPGIVQPSVRGPSPVRAPSPVRVSTPVMAPLAPTARSSPVVPATTSPRGTGMGLIPSFPSTIRQ